MKVDALNSTEPSKRQVENMTPPFSARFRIYVQLSELNLTDSSRKNTPPSVAVFPSNTVSEKLEDVVKPC